MHDRTVLCTDCQVDYMLPHSLSKKVQYAVLQSHTGYRLTACCTQDTVLCCPGHQFCRLPTVTWTLGTQKVRQPRGEAPSRSSTVATTADRFGARIWLPARSVCTGRVPVAAGSHASSRQRAGPQGRRGFLIDAEIPTQRM